MSFEYKVTVHKRQQESVTPTEGEKQTTETAGERAQTPALTKTSSKLPS